MAIRFTIHYATKWGQSLVLIMHSEGMKPYEMQCSNASEWLLDVNHGSPAATIFYHYALRDTDQTLTHEPGPARKISFGKSKKDFNIHDSWRMPLGNSPFLSAAFADCILKRNPTALKPKTAKADLLLRLNCPDIEPDKHLAIVGNQPALGNWDIQKKLRLDESEFPAWSISLDSKHLTFPLEYKYLLVDSTNGEVACWDEGPNRYIETPDEKTVTIITDEHFRRNTPAWKGCGSAIPVFSLRSEKGFGVGEFYDLKKMVDWAKKTGQRIIQTLPVNDTTLHHSNLDSYPYNAVSVYALHPLFLRIENMGKLENKTDRAEFRAKRKELNELPFVNYQQVMQEKWRFFKTLYQTKSPAVFESGEYRAFFEKNREWLVPYAAFSYLRDLNGTPEFGKWKKFGKYNKADIEKFSAPGTAHYPEIAIYYFLQYHLHKQLSEVHDYARKNGVALKGDIPIGVSPNSVDAWVEPELFNSQVQAGAPPDDFSTTGQNWGFPTYNWELMEKDNYKWWRKRFQKLAEYFDAYRIDHILGFFRIWEIPVDAVWGLTGSFHPALPYSRNELESIGLQWDDERFLKPYIKEHVLDKLFGEYKKEVIEKYLLPAGQENYCFKPEFNTQKKIQAHFASTAKALNAKQSLIRDGLYTLNCEVLFIPDIRNKELFHPRIAMHGSATFMDLPESTKHLLDQIYVDYYYHRHNIFWKSQALKKLPALISSTNMLVCGEDLGMVPDSVPEVMDKLEILSLEIQRMPKKPGKEFGIPSEAPYPSVCTTSTHDMNPLRAWWEENPAATQRFYNQALGMQGKAPTTCESWIAKMIIEQHLYSNAMWVILPWQDWMALETGLCSRNPFEERINVPSNPHNFWCYRMHVTLEQLLTETNFNKKITEMIEKSGR
ncbi:MAG TPA: 4-alpha-glucanotransferase [Paludibacter sp.]|nr:4-alpha-glucanotransferase [Paludibacter sp.]